ncbi:MAG: T9SS type A sorting domain-containing protein [Muribaculum sp.]|nr:T9SS type A sorting domain-containing protein [Muribaculum sp.]
MKAIKRLGIALAIIMTVFGNVNLCASENYKSMIRYDRVWESLSQPTGDLIKCMRFDGTEEINGKSYHKIITFRKTIASYDTSILAYTYGPSEDVYESEGFIREEDGIVYTLVVEPKDRVDNVYSGYIFFNGCELNDDEILSEKIVYNFNVKEGDLFELYTFIARLGGVDALFKVIKEDKIVIEGEECRSIEIAPIYYEEDILGTRIVIIEGIGVTDYGSLNYHELQDHPTGLWHNNFLNRVFDNNGSVIYSSSSRYDSLLYDGFSHVEMIPNILNDVDKKDYISFGEDNHLNAIKIYDMNGRLVKSVSGAGRATLSTRDLTSGIYISVAETDGKPISRRKFSVK